jgi:8-oxo-dGTP diphosphatase
LLLIRRRTEPFAGQYAFPGGFIDVGKEDIYETAVRELREETGVSVSKHNIRLIDIRSSPTRDPRDHVIDVGFLAITETQPQAVGMTEEAEPTWMAMEAIGDLSLAFDHKAFWVAVERFLSVGENTTSGGENRA